MTRITFASFVLLSPVVVLSPGPTVALVVSRALDGNGRRSAGVIAGNLLGNVGHVITAGAGLT